MTQAREQGPSAAGAVGTTNLAPEAILSRLSAWLESGAPENGRAESLVKFPGGQSNPTYRLTTARGEMVLRRKPSGVLLPSAHAIDREFRLLSALHPVGQPVPKPMLYCNDATVIGTEFYLMEAVEGRVFWDGTLPDCAAPERRAIYETLIRTLAALHNIEPASVGLADFGRPGNYFERQVERWTRQYRAAQTEDIPAMERLVAWLPASVPAQGRTAIVHGDYRIDNILFAQKSASALAIIDWELATLGDPLADLAYFATAWLMPADGRHNLGGVDFAAAGIPTLDEVVEMYCEQTRRTRVPDLRWHFAFTMFRMVSILQGVKRRKLDGNASSLDASAAIASLLALADAAWSQALEAGAR